ncbi:MAG: hypothetical protein ACK533_12060 [Planctomycetota bacterium]
MDSADRRWRRYRPVGHGRGARDRGPALAGDRTCHALPNPRPSPRASRPGYAAVALLAVAALPGCLTQKVWEGHGAPDGEAAMPTAARVALTPVALTGDALVGAAVALAYIGPCAVCICR